MSYMQVMDKEIVEAIWLDIGRRRTKLVKLRKVFRHLQDIGDVLEADKVADIIAKDKRDVRSLEEFASQYDISEEDIDHE